MLNVEIFEPETLDEALQLLGEWGDECEIVAGGTALVLMLKNGLVAPGALVSLGRISGLDGIRFDPGVGLRVGALATLRESEVSPLIRKHYPTLADTFGTVANIRVRNAATVGGNLSEADYASDPPSTLLAMRGVVKAVSSRGEREISLTEFFVDFYQTSLDHDEIVTELVVPELSSTTRSSYLKFVTRSSEDRPCVGVASVVELDPDGGCADLRVVVGAVAHKPQEVTEAEELAVGNDLNDGLIGEIADGYAESIEPLDDLRGSKWYRTEMIRVFVRRSIEQALTTGGGSAV